MAKNRKGRDVFKINDRGKAGAFSWCFYGNDELLQEPGTVFILILCVVLQSYEEHFLNLHSKTSFSLQ
jgi:hypothetical protein